MAHFIADAIRAHIGDPVTAHERALLAVVDWCEDHRENGGSIGWDDADEVERLLVRELNVGIPYEQVGDYLTWMGR